MTRSSDSISTERRIIERPRLIQALDECDSHAILLLAPAGYGKTTLAQQWVKTVGRSIWLSCTPEHRDVVTFANDMAERLESLVSAAPRAVREYIKAQSTPQRSSRRIGGILAEQLKAANIQWVVIDDYHEVISAPEVEQLIDVLRREAVGRLIVASRLRPNWVTSRRILYGEIGEITRDMLAMTTEESTACSVVEPASLNWHARPKDGPLYSHLRRELESPANQHRSPKRPPFVSRTRVVPASSLRTPGSPIRLSLLPALQPNQITDYLGVDGIRPIQEARDLGFLAGEDKPTLHPLLREFLLGKLPSDRTLEPKYTRRSTGPFANITGAAP